MPSEANYPAMKLLTLAIDHLRAGNIPEAEASFHKVLTHEPTNTTALHQLSLIVYNRGQLSDAASFLKRAVSINPEDLNLLGAYGVLLHEMGQPREALGLLLRVLAANPSHAEIWNAAGICFQETAQPVRAIEFYLRALNLQPDFADAHNNLAVVLTHEGNHDEAIEHLHEAIKLRPDYADCYNNLGVALRNRFEYTAAIAAFRQALRLKPDSADILGGLGEALSLMYDDEAEAVLRHSVELRPGDPEKHWNLSLELLKRGDYPAGWREYQWRWQRTKNQVPLRPFTQPFWLGEPDQEISGATLLLHAEQGFGDTLQFLRYVPLVLAKGVHIILEVQPALQRLVAEYALQFAESVTVIAVGAALPPFDWHIPLMSLPLACGTTIETIPPPCRFTPSAPLRPSSHPLRIGIAWAGQATHARDRERSIPPQALQTLFNLPGCSWVSLQTGPAVSQLRNLAPSIDVPPLPDFLATAKIIDSLDLVITVDTSVAHLAASQGVPTWILLPFVTDWRWLRPTAASTPWYPQARLFRQTKLPSGEPQSDLWQPVIAEVASALKALSSSAQNLVKPPALQ